jgi:hypothetical protein
MRRQVTKATDGGEDKEEQANAKTALTEDLYRQGAYAEALALYQEVLDLVQVSSVCFEYVYLSFSI